MAPKQNKGNASKQGSSSNSQTTDSAASKKLKPATSINVRHILCSKLSVSEAAKAELDTGKSFSEVASKFSEDKARHGGSLGWKVRGSLIGDFEKVAYELEPSSVSKPITANVKTSQGYHIIMVEGRK